MHIAPGSIVGGKYRIERPLSQGGMGSVWVARHATLGSPVAVKFMAPTLAAVPSFVARFEREARIAANLQSPHVVHVQDHGIDDGHPYIVMELLRGEDLDHRLRRVRRLSLPDATRILMQAGKALRRAHEASLVHRDLKPGNIFLARVEDEEVVKILDFGIAKDMGGRPMTEVTRTGEVLGSPYYMSPEQVRGERDVRPFHDLFARRVLVEASAKAKSCATPTGPTGSGVVQVTFAPNGQVGYAVVVGQPFAATDVASCVASIFRGAAIPSFSGGPVTRSQSFSIP
ncbi:protein kinase domain-containing protein [Sorangium sp. So ce1182]|uniref:protein kinase domain-containing protein n=1 Tax=Sorangium sp. So ce1182 TaxID=3133334 RepID=UPI003F6086A4